LHDDAATVAAGVAAFDTDESCDAIDALLALGEVINDIG
jgi:hypothetical protein